MPIANGEVQLGKLIVVEELSSYKELFTTVVPE